MQVLNPKDKNPDILYQEAYFLMQEIDNSHWAIAREYLSTQSDWSTEKNMRFIFDFVRYVDSPEFNYIVNNREAFNKLMGKENIDRSIEIIVYTQINRGIPRPELYEAMKLYEYTNVSDPISRAYKYYIKRKIDEGDDKSLLFTLQEYMTRVHNKDAKVINLYAFYTAIGITFYPTIRVVKCR